MRLPPLLLATLLAACSKEKGPPSIGQRVEDALKERLLAVRGSDEGVVLTDDTPRPEVAERPAEGVRRVYLRGGSLHVPLGGLTGLSVGAGENGLTLRLDYGQGTIDLLDGSGAAEEREFERLKKVGERMWEEFWADFERQFANEPGAQEHVQGLRQTMPAWDLHFARRFEKPLLFRRFALKADAREKPGDLDEVYSDCRLARVKREMIATLGGDPKVPAYAIAAGPTVGIRRGVPGRDAEVRTAVFGPDGMSIRVVVTGSLPEPLLLEVLNSFRPVQSDAEAKRLLAKTSGPLDAALAALAGLHLDPGVKSAVQFLRSLKPLQEQRRELAEGLAAWLKADGEKRAQILAAAD